MRLVAVLLALSLTAGAAATATAARPDGKRAARSGLELEILGELNRVRRSRGLPALEVSPALRAAALAHSRAMARHGYIGHSSPDGTRFADRIRRYYSDQGWSRWAVGETILVAAPGLGGRGVVRAWLESPPHRAIVLSGRWREVGIGVTVAASGPDGFEDLETVIVTADYGSRS